MFKNFISSFVSAEALYPNKPAIVFNEKSMSYQELHQRSNDLAQHLISLGVRNEQIIPLILERDPYTIISMIAVLKAGCAFLPISPITPCARIKFILEDADALLIISNINVDHVINQKITVIKPSDVKKANHSTNAKITAKQLAYVMYTSGSTGNPKGVLIEHRSMLVAV